MLNIEIRKATEADLAAIIDLYAQPDMDNHKVLSLDQVKNVFKKFSAYPCYHIYVAVEAEKVIGTFALLIMDNLAHQGTPSGIVEDVTVHPDCQSQGVGKRMMEYAMLICKAAGCYKLVLSSNVRRVRAHQFYESLGFRQHGVSFLVEG
jgi:ribosomal protein S18 acetylase RimI-like enzyme